MESLIPNYKFFLSAPLLSWCVPIIKIVNKYSNTPVWVGYVYILSPAIASITIFIIGILKSNGVITFYSLLCLFWFGLAAHILAQGPTKTNDEFIEPLHKNTTLLFRRYKAFLWSKIRGKKFIRFDFIQDSYITNDGIILKQGWIMKDSKFVKRLKKV